MLLNTDLIDPADLTGYVRGALSDLERNRFRLARYLPNRLVNDLIARFTRGGEGLSEAATFRAYDAESPIGSRPALSRVTQELPPISRKIRLGEYDQLRQRNADDEVADAILRDAVRMTRQVAARMELARGEALYKGKIQLNENGVIVDVDYGRAAGHTVTAATAWTDGANADPIADLVSWVDTYIAANGDPPGVILTSTRVLRLIGAAAKVRNLGSTLAGTPTNLAAAAVSAILANYNLPPIETYDAQVNVNGAATRVIPDDRLILLPAAVDADDFDGTDLGATMWGTTAEALQPNYGVEEGDEPGIVAGAYTTDDPVAVWTKAAAIGLPVLANPNLSFAADVA